MTTLYLSVSASVALGAGGSGTVSVGPSHANEVWLPTSVSISCTGNIPTPTAPTVATCSIYQGAVVGSSGYIDGTYQVLGAASSVISGQSVYPGSRVFAVWSNCNAGQTATVTVTGTRIMP